MIDPKENARRREILQRFLDKWAAEYDQRQAERTAALRARSTAGGGEHTMKADELTAEEQRQEREAELAEELARAKFFEEVRAGRRRTLETTAEDISKAAQEYAFLNDIPEEQALELMKTAAILTAAECISGTIRHWH